MYRLISPKNREVFQKFEFRFNLGLPYLVAEWKLLISKKYLKDDFIAGLTVACIAIPLSLAIALASGVDPGVGLVTAIVASIVCAFFGGTPLGVSGPAAAMAVLVADVVQQYGVSSLIFIGFVCGLLQVLSGVFRLGQLVRFVPLPVLIGFTAGIGAIIFIGQIPSALGLPAPDQSHVLAVITHIWELLPKANGSAFFLATMAVLIIFLLPYFFPKFPAPLIAVIIPSLLAWSLGLDVQTIGSIPQSIPLPHLPVFPNEHLGGILWAALIVFALASLETLLSSSVVDKMAKAERHDPDQELIGQGLGNIASAFFGGMPATGVIARSALNVHAGAKTRRSAVFHGLILICVVLFLAPLLGRIPLPILAGVMLSIALRMLHPREFIQLCKASNFEGLIYVITFVITVFIDLIAGVQAGILAALIIAAVRMGKTHTRIYHSSGNGPIVVSLDGAVSFLSSSKLESIRKEIGASNCSQGLVFDLLQVESLDASGGSLLLDLFEHFEKQGVRFVVKGLSEKFHRILLSGDSSGAIAKHIALSESEVVSILGGGSTDSNLDRLVYGVERFQREMSSSYSHVFKKLETNQQPHTLFITCSDSRINPNLITSTDPGELFIIRNVGNIIPPFGEDTTPAEGAALEYALIVLKVKEIVICAHSECGAMKYMLDGNLLSTDQMLKTPSLTKWMMQVQYLKKDMTAQTSPRHAAELNALLQVENLKTYPAVRERLAAGNLQIHAWYYDIGKAELDEWDEKRKIFIKIGDCTRSLERRIKAGIQFQVPIPVIGPLTDV